MKTREEPEVSAAAKRWAQVGHHLAEFAFGMFKVALLLAIGLCFIEIIVNRLLPHKPSETLSVEKSRDTLAWLIIIVLIVTRILVSRFCRDGIRYVLRLLRKENRNVAQGQPSSQFIAKARRAFAIRYPDPAIVQDLTLALTSPAGYFDRIKETVDIDSSGFERRSSLMTAPVAGRRAGISASNSASIAAEAPEAGVRILPIQASRKGDLIDEFRVSVGGSPGATLSYLENQGTIIVIIEALFEAIQNDKTIAEDSLADFLAVAVSPIPADPTLVQKVTQSLDALEPKKTGETESLNGAMYRALRQILLASAENYIIFCEVPLTHQRTKIDVSSRQTSALGPQKLRDAVRLGFGLRQRHYVFSLNRASQTMSYHFGLRTPRGMYIFDRFIATMSDAHDQVQSLPNSRVHQGAPAQHIGVSSKYLHVYLRDGGNPNPGSPERVQAVRVELRERPPGLQEVACLLSILLAAMTWIVGVHHDEIFGTGVKVPGAWPTVLFGIPTLLIGWMVSRIDANSLGRASLATVAMVFWLALNSMSAVILVALKSGVTTSIDTPKNPPHIFIFDLAHPCWSIVIISCTIQVVAACAFCISRWCRYMTILLGLTYTTRKEDNYA